MTIFRNPFVAGAVFALAALPVAWLVFHGATGEGWEKMIVLSPLAAALTGALLWRTVARPGRPLGRPILRGAIAGTLTGLLSHPVAWLFLYLVGFATGARSSLGEPVAGPLEILPGLLGLTFFSWITAGLLTVPLGLLTGAALGGLARQDADAGAGQGEQGR
jgi:hypothetical protein